MNYRAIEMPLLPKSRVVSVIMDSRISAKIENGLKGLGIETIKVPICKEVYSAISGHPDILIHHIERESIVVAPNIYTNFKNRLFDKELKVIKGDSILSSNYPNNIAYNIGRVGKYAIHNLKYTDKVTLKLLEQNGISFIDVKQGYAKCSMCVVNDNAIITSDKGIAKALEKNGVDVLIISHGNISLPGLEYGFIGGASGLINKKLMAFTGSLRWHPEFEQIINFSRKYQIEAVFLDENMPIDVGSIIPIFEIVQ
ncbi:MAG: hypothetical protein KGZ33_03530 [Alkaliphilus sp.]|nr:hypothetical protein [Alkaliphilus sp.]